MPISNLYQLEVTEEIATKMRILAEFGVFAAKGGSCEIHFDLEGNISQVINHTYHKVIHNPKLREVDIKSAIL